jgi:hypothetical protein
MQFTDLPQNTSGVLYQNDSPTPLLVTVQVAGSFSTRARTPRNFQLYCEPSRSSGCWAFEHRLKNLSDCSGTGHPSRRPERRPNRIRCVTSTRCMMGRRCTP